MKKYILLLLLLLTACTSNNLIQSRTQAVSQEANNQRNIVSPSEADEVHRQWVTAMQSNDYPNAVALAAQPMKDAVVTSLFNLQKIEHNPDNGRIQRVDTYPTVALGDMRQGNSTFIYGHLKQCYSTKLAYMDGKWKVVDWTLRSNCP